MKNFTLIILIAIIITGIGCSGGGEYQPVAPPMGQAAPSRLNSGARQLWGVWQIAIDTRDSSVEIIPLRGGMFHANVVQYMQPPFKVGMSIYIKSMDLTKGDFNIDVSLTHPFNDPSLTGFDVKGIFISNGTRVSQYDPSIIYANLNEARLLNPDGYTRWWNPKEFTAKGLLGYTEGLLGNKGVSFTNRLNPFKYFSDYLGAEEEFNVEPGSRNRFSPGKTNKRNYLIHFPVVSGNPVIIFNYAVDANWESPVGDPTNIDNFPTSANQPEAYRISIGENPSSIYYDPSTGKCGGQLDLTIDISDYGTSTNPSGAIGETSMIVLESPTLFASPVLLDQNNFVSENGDTGKYRALISNVKPTSLVDQEILIHAITRDDYYDQGYGTPAPDKPLAAYFLYTVKNIRDKIPVPAAPTNLTANATRSASGKLTGFTLDWNDMPLASEYLVYWCTDPYKTAGPMSFTLAPGGVVAESHYKYSILPGEANGQWMLYVVARAAPGDPDTTSGQSKRAFIDFAGFENIVQNTGNIWRIRQQTNTTTTFNRFIIWDSSTVGVDGSGVLRLNPVGTFTIQSLTYCVSPELPAMSGATSCFFEFAHKRNVNFPLLTTPPYTNDYPYGYSICSASTIDSPDLQTWQFPFLQVTDYKVDLVAAADYVSGGAMNFPNIEGLSRRYVDPALEIGDPANGWSGTASAYALSRYKVPAVIGSGHKFVGVCFGGKENGAIYDYFIPNTETGLLCDEFALVIY